MKTWVPVLLLFPVSLSVSGQSFGTLDTLLSLTFSNPNDTVMLSAASGNDPDWVNWDGDKQETNCGLDPEIVPGAWYLEGDLGEEANPAVNYAYTSCSWLSGGMPNDNWLITPPVLIQDSSYSLSWRSLSFQGPQFMDGYKVLVSETINIPGNQAFKDTLFKAAQMLGNNNIYTLNLEDYNFSEGYIHGNSYQDLKYFFIDLNLGGDNGLFHGKLEPHSVHLGAYAGKTIYVAFVHDSYNDFILQIDDIVISNTTSAVQDIPELTRFDIRPNPARESVLISWELSVKVPQLRLQISNLFGQLVWETAVDNANHSTYRFDTQGLAAGIYYCTLVSPQGRSTRRLVKI